MRCVKMQRQGAGMSLAAFCREVGCGRSALCNWEQGQSIPRVTWIPALAKALDMTPQLLVEQFIAPVLAERGKPPSGLKTLRLSLGRTVAEMARTLGWKRSTYFKREQGRSRGWMWAGVFDLARKLGMSADEVVIRIEADPKRRFELAGWVGDWRETQALLVQRNGKPECFLLRDVRSGRSALRRSEIPGLSRQLCMRPEQLAEIAGVRGMKAG